MSSADSLETIGVLAFEYCTSLGKVILPEKITAIPYGCFDDCIWLNEVVVPENVVSIGSSVFLGCRDLKRVIFQGDAPIFDSDTFGAHDVTPAVYYPAGNPTWTADVMKNYGGTVTWVPYSEMPEEMHTHYFESVIVPSTCDLSGYVNFVCECGASYQDLGGNMLGHDWGDGEVIEPTCISQGYTQYTCSRCKQVKYEDYLEMGPHTESILPAVAPTCTETGLTEGKHCSVCNEVLVKQEVVPATGVHVYETEQERVNATCTTDGYVIMACGCGATERTDLPAFGHTEGAVVKEDTVVPTCETAGSYDDVVYCETCQEELSRSTITVPATGHDFADGVCQNCGILDKADYEMFSGKTLTLTVTNPVTGKAYTAKQLTWSMEDQNDAFATLTAAGKLTARKVFEKTRIEVIATVLESGVERAYTVDIYPAVTQIEAVFDGEVIANNATVLMDFADESKVIKINAYPVDTLANVQWTVSDKKGQYAEYAIEDDMLTITNPTGKVGTVTIKASVEAGVKKTITLKVNFGSFAKTVEIDESEKTTLRGGESLTLAATITEPDVVSKPGIVWSTSNKNAATVSNGKVTAKAVAHPTTVTITASSKDGLASDSVELLILPKNEGALVLMNGNTFVTNSTKTLNVGDSYAITAAVITNGEPAPAEVTWTTSKAAVATVENGVITAVGAGTAKITATAGKVKVTMTVKVSTLAAEMEITTKDGKNIIDENGEKIVLLSSGKNVTLVANILTKGAAKAVDWAITEGAEFAKISNGKVTANKDLTSVKYVTVKATAKDGSGVSATIRIKIVPLATGVQIFENGSHVRSNTVYVHDMMVSEIIKLNAKVYPAKANQSVTLTSSNKKVADFSENGELVCFKAGTVTITAAAQDGSGVKATFKLTIVKKVTSLTLKEGSNLTVVGGKSLKLAPMVQINPTDATNKKLTWSVAPNDYGIKISTSGVLSTKKVTEPVTINVMVTTQDGSGKMVSFDVTVKPA